MNCSCVVHNLSISFTFSKSHCCMEHSCGHSVSACVGCHLDLVPDWLTYFASKWTHENITLLANYNPGRPSLGLPDLDSKWAHENVSCPFPVKVFLTRLSHAAGVYDASYNFIMSVKKLLYVMVLASTRAVFFYIWAWFFFPFKFFQLLQGYFYASA